MGNVHIPIKRQYNEWVQTIGDKCLRKQKTVLVEDSKYIHIEGGSWRRRRSRVLFVSLLQFFEIDSVKYNEKVGIKDKYPSFVIQHKNSFLTYNVYPFRFLTQFSFYYFLFRSYAIFILSPFLLISVLKVPQMLNAEGTFSFKLWTCQSSTTPLIPSHSAPFNPPKGRAGEGEDSCGEVQGVNSHIKG
jgi:hypothetical protein